MKWFSLHLSDLGGSTVGDLLDAEGRELGLEIRKLVEELSIVLLTKFKGLSRLKK